MDARRVGRWMRRWVGPPVLAWLAANAVSWAVAAGSGVSWWSVAGRQRWDSLHYVSIATSGYDMFWCRTRYPDFPDVMCGNVAWFPGYPMAIRVGSGLGLSAPAAGVVVTELALLGMFVALWYLLDARLTWANGLALALGTVFPGGIYFHAVFPVALGTLGLLVSVIGVRRNRWWLSALGGFLATGCHLVGLVVVGMLVLSPLFAWRPGRLRVRLAKGLGAAVVSASAVGWAFWLMWRATGRWDAYSTIQSSSYGQGGLHDPLAEVRAAYDFPFAAYYRPAGRQPALVEHALHAHQSQLWVNAVFFGVVLVAMAVVLLRERRLAPQEWAAVLLTGAVVLTPFLAGAVQSWYRNHAEAFVALLLVPRLPRWLSALLLVACAAQYVLLGAMFFSGALV